MAFPPSKMVMHLHAAAPQGLKAHTLKAPKTQLAATGFKGLGGMKLPMPSGGSQPDSVNAQVNGAMIWESNGAVWTTAGSVPYAVGFTTTAAFLNYLQTALKLSVGNGLTPYTAADYAGTGLNADSFPAYKVTFGTDTENFCIFACTAATVSSLYQVKALGAITTTMPGVVETLPFGTCTAMSNGKAKFVTIKYGLLVPDPKVPYYPLFPWVFPG